MCYWIIPWSVSSRQRILCWCGILALPWRLGYSCWLGANKYVITNLTHQKHTPLIQLILLESFWSYNWIYSSGITGSHVLAMMVCRKICSCACTISWSLHHHPLICWIAEYSMRNTGNRAIKAIHGMYRGGIISLPITAPNLSFIRLAKIR